MADREFLLKIVGDVSSAQKSIGALETDVKGFKSTAGTVGKAVIGAIAVDQIIQGGKAVVTAASDQEQAIGALHSVYGDYSDDMDAFGKTTAENLGISRAEFSQLAAVTGAMLKNANVPLDEVASSTQDLTTRAADLAAMYGGTVPEAMAAMNSALKGEMDPLEKYGVSLKASAIEAKALEMGLVDSEGKVTSYGKAMATQALIMEQSADAAGTFAEESGTLAGQQAIMSAQFKDTQAQIGKALLPTIVKLAGVLKSLIEFVSKNTDWLIPLAAGIVAVVTAVKAWSIAQKAIAAATQIATAAQAAFNIVMNMNPIGLIILAVTALIALFVTLYTKVDWFREAVDTAVSAVLGFLKGLWEWISENWPLLLAILTGPFGLAIKFVIDHWEGIKEAVSKVFDWIKTNWPLLLAILTGPFGLAVLAIVKNWETITAFFKELPGKIVGWLSTIWSVISSPFITAKDKVVEALGNVTQWFKDLPGNVTTWLTNLSGKFLAPFTTAKDEITKLLVAIGNWFVTFPGKVSTAFSTLATMISKPFSVAFSAIKTLWNNTVGGFGFTVPSWVPGVGGKGFKIPEMARGGIVTRPTVALIGEAGPEAVVPLNSAGFGNVTINVFALTATAEVGRKVYEALKEYERTSGRSVGAGALVTG